LGAARGSAADEATRALLHEPYPLIECETWFDSFDEDGDDDDGVADEEFEVAEPWKGSKLMAVEEDAPADVMEVLLLLESAAALTRIRIQRMLLCTTNGN
jgi:hypothetical protein